MALLAIAASCTSDVDMPVSESMDGEDVMLKLDISGECDTRGVVTATKFTQGDEIRLIVASIEKPESYYYDTKATYNGDEWVIAERINLSKFRRQGITDYTVKAIYPYDKTGKYDIKSDGITISTLLDQTDLMTGNANQVNREHPTAKIVFNHILSRITLNVNNTGNNDITLLGITAKETQNSPGYITNTQTIGLNGSIPLNLQWIFPDTDAKSVRSEMKVSVKGGTSEAIDVLIPSTSDIYNYWVAETGVKLGGINFTLNILSNGSDKSVDFNILTPNWESGHQYTYNVNLPTNM